MPKFQKYLLGMFFVILGINILGLWTVEYLSIKRISKLEKIVTNLESDVNIAIRNSSVEKDVTGDVLEFKIEESKKSVVEKTPKIEVDTKLDEEIGEIKEEQGEISSLMDKLQSKLSSLSKRLKMVENNQAASTNVVYVQPISASSTIKEQTVYIGSGSSSSTSWTDVDSAVIELNSANYLNLKRAIFEANISIIGGEAFARLKNKTTGQVIEISTVTHNTSTSTQKLSSSFGLTAGSNNYVVQLRSSSNEKVILDGARLRLFY